MGEVNYSLKWKLVPELKIITLEVLGSFNETRYDSRHKLYKHANLCCLEILVVGLYPNSGR